MGIITSAYAKDPTDPTWKDDKGMNEWRAFMKEYIPDGDLADGGYVAAYGSVQSMLQTLKQCGDNLSRENIMKQATSLKDQYIPTLIPGITVNTGPKNYHPIRQMQLSRWTGDHWALCGEVVEGAG